MTNITTCWLKPDANLSKGMHQFNGVYTQSINRKHRRVGHQFRGRFDKSILVDKDAYLELFGTLFSILFGLKWFILPMSGGGAAGIVR